MLLATRAKQIGPVRTAPWLIYLRSSKVVLAGLVSERRLALPTRAKRRGGPSGPPLCLSSRFVRQAWTQKSIPPMPGSPPAGAGGVFSGLSAMTASVVRNSAAIDAAFCSAERVTLVG